MLFCYTTGIVFPVRRMKKKRPSLKMFWQNQRRQVLAIFGGDLMPDIPHLNESDLHVFSLVYTTDTGHV